MPISCLCFARGSKCTKLNVFVNKSNNERDFFEWTGGQFMVYFFSCTATTLPDTKSLLPKKIARIITKIYVFFLNQIVSSSIKIVVKEWKIRQVWVFLLQNLTSNACKHSKMSQSLHLSNSNLAFGVNFKSCRVRGPRPSSLSYFNLEFLILVFGHSFTLSYFLHI